MPIGMLQGSLAAGAGEDLSPATRSRSLIGNRDRGDAAALALSLSIDHVWEWSSASAFLYFVMSGV